MNISKFKFSKQLSYGFKRAHGRLNGKITIRSRGSGHKRKYYQNFFRNKGQYKGIIISAEYNPNKTSFLLKHLVKKPQGFFYQNSSATLGSDVFQTTQQSAQNLELSKFSVGDLVCEIEKFPGSGPKFARSAGTYGKILSFAEKRGLVRVQLPSGEQYYFSPQCSATFGRLNNVFHQYLQKWKAGISRKLNVRPIVRGVAKNPVDHPHGGGEGKSTAGRAPVTPTGFLTKGVPTRKKKKNSFFLALKKPAKNK